jgi:hypothetical protein
MERKNKEGMKVRERKKCNGKGLEWKEMEKEGERRRERDRKRHGERGREGR